MNICDNSGLLRAKAQNANSFSSLLFVIVVALEPATEEIRRYFLCLEELKHREQFKVYDGESNGERGIC